MTILRSLAFRDGLLKDNILTFLTEFVTNVTSDRCMKVNNRYHVQNHMDRARDTSVLCFRATPRLKVTLFLVKYECLLISYN